MPRTAITVNWDQVPTAPVLLYDGLCGLCNGFVNFILRHDADGALRFAPLQGDFAAGVMARHPQLAGVDSLVLVEIDDAGNESVSVRSEAALRVAARLGGGWRAARVLRLLPRPLRDFGYDLVARVRYRLFGRHESCPIPPPEVRARFIP
jgi:predicted DCC family thiol-disulfide oxidoreductase YuxK